MTEKRRGKITAAEHMAQLYSDPEWVRRHEEREAAHKARGERIQKEMDPEDVPLMADIAAAKVRFYPTKLDMWDSEGTITGPEPIAIRSINNLVNTLDNYPVAIPIMVKHLRTAKHPGVVENLARALTVKEARGTEAPRVILDKLKRRDFLESTPMILSHQNHSAFTLANALVVVGDAGMVDEIKALIADPRHADIQSRLKDALKHCERLAKRSSERSASLKRNQMP
jgi:hypothetical protein